MPFIPRLSDKCTVQWTRPQIASCSPITGYNVAITTVNPSANVTVADLTHETVALKPFESYTASITAMNSLGEAPCSYDFTTSRGDSEL